MSNLAIRGHATRGKEVIEILEMLGGKNHHKYIADCESLYFYIDGDTKIIYFDWLNCLKNGDVYLLTLEEFLEKFPYKIGDKVLLSIGGTATIKSMYWSNEASSVRYEMQGIDDYDFDVTTLQLYTEQEQETMKENKYRLDKSDDDKLATDVTCDDFKIFAPDNYLIGKVTKVDGGMIVEYVKKQPQYPKTYKECAKELGYNQVMPTDHILGYKGTLLSFFQQLLICRDAYWKIAGEQMGLGKPWRPSKNDDAYGIFRLKGEIVKDNYVFGDNLILEFPTEEMRDEFYENFKELIEDCKELL